MKWWMLPLVFVIGAGAGWFSHRPDAVYIEDVVVSTVHGHETVIEKEVKGPVHVETRTETVYTPGPEKPGPTITKIVTRVEQRDPVVITKNDDKEFERVNITDHKNITITSRPDWGLGLGAQVLPDRRIQLTLERRVAGPLWAQAWALQPIGIIPPAIGIGLKLEF